MNLLFNDSVHPGKQFEVLTSSQSDDLEQPGAILFMPVKVMNTAY